MEPNTTDHDEQLAEQLYSLLADRGIPSVVHQDRSPWGVRIWLTPHDGTEYATPSLFVLVENEKWFLCLGGFSEELDEVFNAFIINWHAWDRGVEALADDLVPLVKILSHGQNDLMWQHPDEGWRWDG